MAAFINAEQAAIIASDLFGITGIATPLQGEADLNFRLDSEVGSFLLKIGKPGTEDADIRFQISLLQYLSTQKKDLKIPRPVSGLRGECLQVYRDSQDREFPVRLLEWLDGRLWSSVNPITDSLLMDLGKECGMLCSALEGFNHPHAHRHLDWDLAQSLWAKEHLDLFSGRRKEIISRFLDDFLAHQEEYGKLRKSVIHNDANDNNILVSMDRQNPEVEALIDYGDAIQTQTINDLAIALAYAMMHKPDPLRAALPLVRGYHSEFPLREEELSLLHVLIGMRLVISVTKSALNKQAEPDNAYLQISEQPAWDLLEKWAGVNQEYATYGFRWACGMEVHPKSGNFRRWAAALNRSLSDLFPSLKRNGIYPLDLSAGSVFAGHKQEAEDPELFGRKIEKLLGTHPDLIPAGGYLEPRALYSTKAYEKEGNEGKESRSVHLGIDFWIPPGTPVHALFDGEVFCSVNDAGKKEYGGLIILKHKEEDITFFSLHGHQSLDSVGRLKKGDRILRGQEIGRVGTWAENGNWVPHLHFQFMLSMLDQEEDFPGVAYPQEVELWREICPDPGLIFGLGGLEPALPGDTEKAIAYRKRHLGRGLSLSYSEPLKMVLGDGAHLIDHLGRRFLDTVNNVAHVGHEHPRVVEAGRRQMGVLNTNTRYLHDNILEFTDELLGTFPEKLSVVHLVNSGSEANELALRMAQTFSMQKDMIALEVGYHGNTSACVAVSSYKFDGKGGSGAPEHTHVVPLPDAFRGRYRGAGSGPNYAAHVKEIIEQLHAEGKKPAGFIFESIMSCGGQINLPDGFLEEAFLQVRETGGLCIADEVQVGCGRVGKHFWGFQLHGVVPDIVTIGKPIGNGHPLGAVVCTPEVAKAFANGMEYFNTFGGNPVSCAIGTEVLRVIRDEGLQEHALGTGSYLKEALLELQKEFPLIGEVRGEGLFLGIELTDPDLRPLSDQTAYLANRMKDLGILMSTDGRDVNVLKIKPPMVFSRENSDELLSTLRRVLSEDFMRI